MLYRLGEFHKFVFATNNKQTSLTMIQSYAVKRMSKWRIRQCTPVLQTALFKAAILRMHVASMPTACAQR